MGRCRRCRSAALALVLASTTALADEAHDGALHVGELALRLGGFVQADGVLFAQASEDQLDGATGAPLNETRFSIRRAHLRADAAWRFVSGAFEVEGSTVTSSNVRLFDAEVSARWPTATPVPLAMLSMGLLRIPFGFENQQLDYDRVFLERSAVVRALFPGENDLGARLAGGWSALRWQLAVMNGHPLGDASFPALDPTAAKDWLGRLGVDVPVAARARVVAGVSALTGTGLHAGTPATKDSVEWVDDNGDGVVQPSELRPVPGVAATPSLTFHRAALGADALVAVPVPRLGLLTVYGELVWATNLDRALLPADPISVGRDLREWGGYLGFTQELWSRFVVGVRYDRYNPDEDATFQSGALRVPKDASFSTLAVVAAVEAPPWGRFTVEYDHNGNALGLTPSGAPTTLDRDVLGVRAQLVF